jgi:hypothetical protein
MYNAIGVFGYPKSGNTWVQSILASLGQQVDPSYVQHDIHVSGSMGLSLKPHPVIRIGAEPAVVFKSHEYFKTTGFEHNNPKFGVKKLTKAVLVKRNPLDMLLSYINYIRFVSQKRRDNNQPFPKGLQEYCIKHLQLPVEDLETKLIELYSLEYLRDHGILSNALSSFISCDLGVPPFTTASSTWDNQILSWEQQKEIELLVLRYEDLVSNHSDSMQKLAEFIGVNPELLYAASASANAAATKVRNSEMGNKNALFYNKMSCGYFVDFFEKQSLQFFVDKHRQILNLCGYEEYFETRG